MSPMYRRKLMAERVARFSIAHSINPDLFPAKIHQPDE